MSEQFELVQLVQSVITFVDSGNVKLSSIIRSCIELLDYEMISQVLYDCSAKC